jgi:hypothetical protein
MKTDKEKESFFLRPDSILLLRIARHLKIANRKTEFGVVYITI